MKLAILNKLQVSKGLVKDVLQGKRNPVHDLTKKKSKNKSFIYIHYIFYCIEI